jgi:flagellar protein FliS
MYVVAKRSGVKQYSHVHVQCGIEEASPHRLIQMLMEEFLFRVNAAKGALVRGDITEKGENISKAILVVGGLNEGLDLERGGALAGNLRNLYQYMTWRLTEANAKNEPEILDELSKLMREIKSAWDAIPENLHYYSRESSS